MLRGLVVTSALVAGCLAAVAPSASADDGDYADPAHARASTVEVAGELLRVVSDDFEAHSADRSYLLAVTDGPLLPVSFTEDVPAGDFTGQVVVPPSTARGVGIASGSTVEADSTRGTAALDRLKESHAPAAVATASIEPAVASAAVTPKAHTAYVAVMDGSMTTAAASMAVTAIATYWKTEAGSAMTSFDVHPTARSVASGLTSCDVSWNSDDMWESAAAAFGLPLSHFGETTGRHLVVIAPAGCYGEGVATLGGSGIGGGGLSVITVNPSTQLQTGAHELGHNFGLDHANLEGCCEYHDLYSPMGSSIGGIGTAFTPPALGTLYRRELDLLGPGETAQVTEGTTRSFALSPRGTASGLRGLLVTDPSDGTVYSVDLRLRTGRDADVYYGHPSYSGAGNATYGTGVVIERQDGDGDTYLVPRRSGGTTFGSYVAGTTFAPSSSLSVAVTAVSASGATVTVSFPQHVPADPTVPSITGTAKVGEQVAATTGTWPDGTTGHTYAWLVDDVPTGATGSTFQVPPSAADHQLKVAVTATPPGGSVQTRTSAPAIVARGTYDAGTVAIAGIVQVGRIVTVVPSGWPSDATLLYTWRVNGVPATAATASTTYVVPAGAAGKQLSVSVAASRQGYEAPAASPSSARPVAPGALAYSAPRVSGTAKVKKTLTAIPGVSTPRGAAPRYQWLANGKPIARATARTYKIPKSMKGKRISVRVTGYLAGYAPRAVMSAQTAKVKK